MLLLLLGLLAQTPVLTTLHGQVVDSAAQPIAHADVRAAGPAHGAATTAADGTFTIQGLPAGRYRVRITAPGFEPYDQEVVAPAEPLRAALLPARLTERVLVTAARGQSRVVDTAAPVSVVSAADIERAPSPVLDDVLRSTPGFSLFRRTSSRSANPTTQGATLRGLAASGASRALVLADGSPLNDPFGGWVYWNRVPAAAIDRVEVVRGGASDLYGADALAGVIQVITASPPRTTARVFADGDSNRTARASALGAWRGGGTLLLFTGEASRTGGTFVVSRADRGPIDTRAGGDYATGEVKAAREWASGWRLTGLASSFGESRRNGTRLQSNDTSVRHAQAEAAGPAAGGYLQISGELGDQQYHQSFSAIGAGRLTETLTSRQTVPSSVVGAGTTWRRLFGGTDLLVGADLREVVASNRDTSFQPDGRVRAATDLRGFSRTSGVFAQVRTTAGSRTTLVAGARGDFWSSERGDIRSSLLSPRASVSVRLSAPLTVRVAAGRSFRAPTLNERIRPFRAGNILTLANPDLDVETLSLVEGSLLAQGHAASLRITGFSSWLDGAVTNVTLQATPALILRQRQNAGGVAARGLEGEGDWRLRPALTVSGSLAWTRSTFRDTEGLTGNDVPQVPGWQSTVGVRWTTRRDTTLQAQLRSFSDQFEDDRNTLVLRGSTLLDLSATGPMRRGLSWVVSLENAFDTEYDTGRTPTRTIGIPRTVRAGVRVEWK